MTDLRKAATQALEALDGLSEDAVCQSSHHAKKDQHTSLDVCPVFLRLRAAATALRAALAIPEPEPVAWMKRLYLPGDDWDAYDFSANRYGEFQTPLYASPPQRKPLTDEEILSVLRLVPPEPSLLPHLKDEAVVGDVQKAVLSIARAIERAHGLEDN